MTQICSMMPIVSRYGRSYAARTWLVQRTDSRYDWPTSESGIFSRRASPSTKSHSPRLVMPHHPVYVSKFVVCRCPVEQHVHDHRREANFRQRQVERPVEQGVELRDIPTRNASSASLMSATRATVSQKRARRIESCHQLIRLVRG